MTRAPAAALLSSALQLCQAGSLGEAADVLADTARALVGADGSHVFWLDDDGSQHTINSAGTDTHRGALHVDPGERSLVLRCLELGTTFVQDAGVSDLVNAEICARFQAASLLAVPLGDVGGLVLWWHTRRSAPRAAALAAVETVAAQAAAVLVRLADLEVLRGQTLTDPLTGLANRRALVGRLEALPTGGTVALVDLDHFKRLNDEHGHRYGDQVLCRFADLLAPLAGADGCVARYGGEEFALVLPRTNPADVAAALQSVRTSWALTGGPTFSAGVAPHRPGGLPSETLEAADRALYEAKRTGRDRDVLSPETAWTPVAVPVHALALPLPRAASSSDPLPIELLDEALERGLVVPHYQPVVVAATGEVVALEALARLIHPRTGELLVPAQFLPLAERTGRAARLDDLVAEQAVAACSAWRRTHPGRPISVGINVSVADLDDASMAGRLLARCADRGLDADALVVEVTETLASQRGRGHEQALQQLSAAGVNITIDDFGTGFASLEYLLRFPVAGVKIDRTFTWALDQPRGRDLVRAVVDLGRQLGLHVVAEGVETPEQLAFLVEVGCPFVQGYLLGRPVPGSAVPALLKAGAPLPVAH